MKRFWSLSTLLLLLMPMSVFAQGSAFQFDVRGVGGLYSHTPTDPIGTWAFIGGTIPPPTVEEESDVIAMDADSTGTLFGVDVFLNILGTISPVNGDFTTIAALSGDIPPDVSAMTIDEFDVAWVSDGLGLWMMDLNTGVCTLVAAQFTNTAGGAAVTEVFELATDGAGNFWAFDITLDTLWSLDETNGNVTALGVFPGPGNPNFSNNGMDWDPVSGQLIGDVYTGGGTGVYGIWDTTTGVFTAILEHSAYPLDDARVGGPIACHGGTTYQVDFYLDSFMTFDTPDPSSNLTRVPQPEGTAIFAMDFNETGTLYVVDNGGRQVGTMDPTTGAFTPTVPLSGDLDPFTTVVGISCDPTGNGGTGQFYAATTTSLYTLDVTTGATSFVADFDGEPLNNAPDTVIELAFDNSGDLYIFTIGDNALYRTDKTTGISTFLGFAPVDAAFIQGMDVDPETDELYGSVYISGGTGIYGTWNKTTGVLTTIAALEDLPPDGDGYELKLAFRPPSDKVSVTSDTLTVNIGSLNSGGLPELAASDNVYAIFDPVFQQFRYQSEFEVTATSPTLTPSAFEFNYEGKVFNLVGTVTCDIRLFNYTNGTFDSPVSSPSTPTDSVISIIPAGPAADYVDPVSGEMRARIFYDNDPAFFVFNTANLYLPFRVRADQVFWSITQ